MALGEPELSPSRGAQKLLPGPTFLASHGPSILGSIHYLQKIPAPEQVSACPASPNKAHRGHDGMMADWLIGRVYWEQTPTNSRRELVLVTEERDPCENISPWAESRLGHS